MTIKELCKKAHNAAIEKGFWLIDPDAKIVQRNPSELLMLIVSELGEACEALRHNNTQNKTYNKVWKKDTFEDEIADTFIRLADMCQAMGIDIEWQIQKKLEYNKTRPQKHGKEF
jgi:NTP pyrophosphatase (non-canonical NTP hydrolase)